MKALTLTTFSSFRSQCLDLVLRAAFMNHGISFDSLLNMCQNSVYFLLSLITTITVYRFLFNFPSLLTDTACVETMSIIYKQTTYYLASRYQNVQQYFLSE